MANNAWSAYSVNVSGAMNREISPRKKLPVPFLCWYWCSIVDILPVIKIGKLNVSLTIFSAMGLAIVRYLLEYGMVVLFQWPQNSYVTKNAAASAAAIVHSLQLVPSLYVCFRTIGYNPSQKMADVSEMWWQTTANALLQFCTGYMIYDGLLNILWLKSMFGNLTGEDYLFLGHHVATILYMTSTRVIGAGHQSAMVCMLLGECTNPLHNSFYIGLAAQTLPCCNGVLSQFLFHWVEYLFAVMYVLARAIIAPWTFLHVTVNLWTIGRRNIPISLLLMWCILIWGVLFGSVPWIQECWATMQKYHVDPSPLLLSALSPEGTASVIRTEL
jgi:TLC domain